MSDHLPYADLVHTGGGLFEGPLFGIPDMLVRVSTLTPTERSVGLWDVGKHLVGTGLLKRSGDQWTGECSHFAGKWYLTARAGSKRLEFREHGEVAA